MKKDIKNPKILYEKAIISDLLNEMDFLKKLLKKNYIVKLKKKRDRK